jgi:hypothetical protein
MKTKIISPMHTRHIKEVTIFVAVPGRFEGLAAAPMAMAED